MDELDRILSMDDGPEPSSGFVASVMAAVEERTALPPPIPFPWRRFAAGAVAAVAASIAGVAFGQRVVSPETLEAIAAPFAVPAFGEALAWTGGSLLTSWVLFRFARRVGPVS